MGSQAGPSTSTSGSSIGEKQINPMYMPYLNDALTNAQALFNSGAGAQPYSGPTQAGLNPHLDQSLKNYQGMIDQLIGNNAGAVGNAAAVSNIQSGGLTPGMSGDISRLRGLSSNMSGLAGTAQGQNADVINRLTATASNPTQLNPFVQQMLDANNARIGNQVNSTMAGMGRFNSGAHADVLGRTLAETDNPILAQAYEAQQGRALQANQNIAGIRQADTGLAGNLYSGAGSLTGAALGGENAGADRSLNWARLVPTMQQAAVSPYLMHGEIGNFYQDRLQKEMDNAIGGYNAGQNMGWSQLAKYLGAVQGVAPAFAGTGPFQEMKQSESKTSTPFGIQQGIGLGTAAAGKMSDITTKTDIEKVGTHDMTGLDIFAYRYKGDPKTYPKVVGPMAQDVKERFPSAVGEVGGKLYIKPWAVAAFHKLKH